MFDRASANALEEDLQTGDTALERQPQVKKVQEARCYSLASSVERPRRSVAPAAAGKGDGRAPKNAYQRLVEPLVKVTILSLLPIMKQSR